MKVVDRLYFKPSLPDDYTTAMATDKTYYDDCLVLDMKKAAENYGLFTQDWFCLFSQIFGQICPMMVQ